MPKLTSLKDALLGSDENEEYHYECKACDARFTSSEPTVQSVSCPRCGAHRVGERLAGGL